MLRNPLTARAQRRTSRMLTRVGWEPPQTWPVPRPGATPLVFQTRLPAAEFVPVTELPARHRDAPASVGGATMPLAETVRTDSVFLAAAICSTQADHGVLATMTAALAAQPLPFLAQDGTAAPRHSRRKVKGMPGRVTMIERQHGEAPDAPLVVQYAVSHRTTRSRSPSSPRDRRWRATPGDCSRTSCAGATSAPPPVLAGLSDTRARSRARGPAPWPASPGPAQCR